MNSLQFTNSSSVILEQQIKVLID